MTNNAPGGIGNDLILDDITFRACGPVIVTSFATTKGPATTQLCQGDTGRYTLHAQVQSSNNPPLQWQVYNNSTGWQDVTTGGNTDSLRIAINGVPGLYQYRIGVSNGSDITSASCRVYSDPIIFNVEQDPVIAGVNPVQPKCVGDTLTLLASGGVTYQWAGPNLAPTSQNPVVINNISAANAGKYTVIAYNQYDCSSTASTMVTVNPVPVAAVTGGTTICAGDSTRITASGGTGYLWSPGASLSDSTAAAPVAHPVDTTTYTVKVYNNAGCFDTKTVTINVLHKAIANAGKNKVIFEGQSTTLNGSEKYGSTYSWTPDSALSDPTSLTPVASPTNDITYTLHVNSSNNCGEDSSSVFVKVYKKITIPNTFSPNNDGINDLWNIDALITYPDCILDVFDRYGQKVFHSIGYNNAWNGKYNGKALPSGTYYYVLDLRNKTPKISGWVLLVK